MTEDYIDVTREVIKQEEERIKLLQSPDLLYDIIIAIQQNGVIGEENTIMALVNKINMRLVKNAHPTSSNLIVSDKTGGGKDYLITKTCEIIVPKEKYYHRTDISDKTFDYWKPIIKWEKDENGKSHPVTGSWDGCILHLEDPREEALNGQSFKVMSSGGNEVTKVIDGMARDIKIDGKPGIIVSSLKTSLDLENSRRWSTIRIDTTLGQTKAINKDKLRHASGKNKRAIDGKLKDALHKNLFPREVTIPYAEDLFNILPENLLSRTQTDQLLDSIRSSAVLHQHQRKKTDSSTIEANHFDLAYGLFVFTLLNSNHGIPINTDEEDLLAILLEKGPVSINELSKIYKTHTKQWIYNNREKLANKGFIETYTERTEFKKTEDTGYSKDIEMITIGENANLILKGFNEILKMPHMDDFNDINDFKDICIRIDKKREKDGVVALFTQITLKSLISENQPVETVLKSVENPIKITQHDRVNEIREYCMGKEFVSITALNDHFIPSDVSHLIESGLLVKIPSNNGFENYKWGG